MMTADYRAVIACQPFLPTHCSGLPSLACVLFLGMRHPGDSAQGLSTYLAYN